MISITINPSSKSDFHKIMHRLLNSATITRFEIYDQDDEFDCGQIYAQVKSEEYLLECLTGINFDHFVN